MPGDYAILYKDIRIYRKGESFTVRKIENGKSTSEAVEYNPEVIKAYSYYYGIWENWFCFKQLPNAGNNGTSKEIPWILDFLKYFDRIFQEIENYRSSRR